MPDDKYKSPKWEAPEMEDWDSDFEEEEFDERVTGNIGCRPSWSPCRPTQPIGCRPTWSPCRPRYCYPRYCYPRQCRPRYCRPRQCNPQSCYPRIGMSGPYRPCNPL